MNIKHALFFGAVFTALSNNAIAAFSVLGDQVQGTLTAGFLHTLNTPFSSSLVTVGADPEFVGNLTAHWDPDIFYDVTVDIFGNHFTVAITETQPWIPVTAIGTSVNIFTIELSDLNGGDTISSVAYNDALTVGFTGGSSPLNTLSFTDTSIQLGFKNIREGNVYHFDINPVPLPAAFPLFVSALSTIGLFAWRKQMFDDGQISNS